MSAFRALSWGAGWQSTTLGAMSALGEIDHLDLVIHADTGWERKKTYEARDWYTTWLRERGIHVEIVSAGNVRQEGAYDHIHIPFWTDGGGPLTRQCTRNFKIVPIKHKMREILGFPKSLPPHPPAGTIELWMGISTDERSRAKKSRVQYIRHRFPLLEMGMDRQDCADWLKAHDLPVPVKSACIGCPFRRASEWLKMKEENPEEWADAVAFDRENRDNPLARRDTEQKTYIVDGETMRESDLAELLELVEMGEIDSFDYEVTITKLGSTADQLYIWRESEPLDEADLEYAASRERRHFGTRQLEMFGCDSGYCGV